MTDIQDYFKYIFKKYGENTNKPLVQKYLNKIENRITFKIKDIIYKRIPVFIFRQNHG